MMWQVMLYATGVAAAFSVMGYCEERLAFLRDMPRRWVWPLTMVLSIAWVPIAMLWTGPAAVATPGLELVVTPAGELDVVPREASAIPAGPPASAPPAGDAPTGTAWTPPSDQTLLSMWVGTSALLLLSFLAAGALLRKRSARWRRARVLGREVMVSESVGPALMGAWQPRMVVPEWFMAEAPERQELILQHEEQHIAARDPMLLRAATLFTLALPWNLPLWWQLMRMRQAIELDCDARVLRNGASPAEYGSVLLAVTRRCANVPAGLIAMSEPVSALERRIRHLVPDASRRSVWRAGAALLLWMVGVGAAVGLEAPPLPQRAQPVVPPLLPPPPDSAWQRQVRQALVDQHPELFTGAQPEGVAFVTMELRPDGSVAHSRLRRVPESDAAALLTATSKELKGFGLWVFKSGTAVADGATAQGPLNLFVTRLESAPDDDSRFSKEDIAAALERHLPDALTSGGTSPRGTPWLVLSRDGKVIRSGYIALRDNAFDIGAFNAQVPGLTLCAYQITQDVRTSGSGNRARSVILAWVQEGVDLPRLLPSKIVAPPDRRAILERAIVERHPELVSGAERDGQAFVSVQLRPDGSVADSALRYVEAGDAAGMDAAMRNALEPFQGQLLLARGWKIADGATVKSQIRVSYRTKQDAAAIRAEQQEWVSEYADVQRLVEHHLPGAMTDPRTMDKGMPYLILSRDGQVLKSGYFVSAATSATLATLQGELPGKRVTTFALMPRYSAMNASAVNASAANSSRSMLMIGWVQP